MQEKMPLHNPQENAGFLICNASINNCKEIRFVDLLKCKCGIHVYYKSAAAFVKKPKI